jgi:hypothetical protein
MNEWDFYLGGSEGNGGYSGDVAATWNEYAAQSGFYLDQANSAIDDGRSALEGAAHNLGTDPNAVNGYLEQATADFYATNDAMWSSMGFDGGMPDQGGYGAQY